VAWSPGGRRLASAGADGTVRVWDARTGRQALTLRGHTGMVYSVSWSPDGSRLGSAGADKAVRVWDARAGRQALTLTLGRPLYVFSVSWSPDGSRLASAGIDQTVRVWDARTGEEALTLRGHTGMVYSVSWSPDGSRLASAGIDQTVRVWDARTGQEPVTLSAQPSTILSVSWSPDGSRLATAAYEQAMRVWDARTGREAFTLLGHTDGVTSVSWSPDGSRLASAGADGRVKVWDARTGQDVLTLRAHPRGATNVTWSPDGRRLASAGNDGTVRIWESSRSVEDLRRREIVSLVCGRFDKLLLRSEVLASVRKDPGLDAADRVFALQVARTMREDPAQLNAAAWEVVKVRGLARGAYDLGLRQAQAAVDREPANGKYWNTLGAAHYRAGHWKAAIAALMAALRKSDPRQQGQQLGFNPFFLAMAHRQLGEERKARWLYDQAVRWMDGNQPQNAELRAIRTEAAELLGIRESALPRPAASGNAKR
jgi:hypothetical protein